MFGQEIPNDKPPGNNAAKIRTRSVMESFWTTNGIESLSARSLNHVTLFPP